MPGSLHRSGGRQNGQSDADRKRKDSIFHTLLVSRRVSPFPPYQKKIHGVHPSSGVQEPPSLMAVSALGTWGWAVLTTKPDVGDHQQSGQSAAASARYHRRPPRCQRLQEIEANAGSADVLGLTSLKAQRESWTRPSGPPRLPPCSKHRLRPGGVRWRWRRAWV